MGLLAAKSGRWLMHDAEYRISVDARIATDAPVVGAGSGDFVIAFSTTNHSSFGAVRGPALSLLGEDALSPLFEAAAEATEEAIDDSLLTAESVTGRDGHTAVAIPISRLREILAEAGDVK